MHHWQKKSQIHLSYCLNIHKGEAWGDIVEAVRSHSTRVRDAVSPGRPFGLGLRLGAEAVGGAEEPGRLEELRGLMRQENLYAFTINGFPYGRFHETTVKEEVYRPDWTTSERVNYTKDLGRVLAELLSEVTVGSISTVPVSYKPWMSETGDVEEAVKNLVEVAGFLAELKEGTGKEIHLGLEPEPDCYLETTAETVAFFRERIFRDGARLLQANTGTSRTAAEEILRRHLGVCFDTCHVAMQFEELADSWKLLLSEGIRISKLQVSNALEITSEPAAWKALEPFDERVYLHQVKAMTSGGEILSWPDLPQALREGPGADLQTVRSHFHVPLFFEESGPLRSTAASLTPEFFALVRQGDCPHIEIETYAYDVLPPELQLKTVEESIAREFDWLLGRMGLPE